MNYGLCWWPFQQQLFFACLSSCVLFSFCITQFLSCLITEWGPQAFQNRLILTWRRKQTKLGYLKYHTICKILLKGRAIHMFKMKEMLEAISIFRGWESLFLKCLRHHKTYEKRKEIVMQKENKTLFFLFLFSACFLMLHASGLAAKVERENDASVKNTSSAPFEYQMKQQLSLSQIINQWKTSWTRTWWL